MSARPTKKPAQKPNPSITKGDDVFFTHADHGPVSGKVLAHGAHGCTIDHEGQQHKVYWSDVLGHKNKSVRDVKVVDKGESGFIVQDDTGVKKYIEGQLPVPERDDTENDHIDILNYVNENTVMNKSLEINVDMIFFKSGIANNTGLQKKQITDKNGNQTTRWVKTGAEDPEKTQGSANGYGTHDIQPGSKVKYKAGEHAGEGKVTAIGKHGATVSDSTGREHNVLHHEITHFQAGDDVKQPKVNSQVLGKQDPIPADKFNAADYAKSHDQADVSADSILVQFPPDTKERIASAQDRLKDIEQTIDKFKQDSKWAAQREILHHKIISELLSPEAVKGATPEEGQPPTFTILGGRGGSGKSSFAGTVYDPKKAIVLDADHIKGLLPEYEGWNAFQVHEESGDIFDRVTDMAKTLGLNIVHDATMKTPQKAVELVNNFKGGGYKTEAHYMHLPRQEAAKRAVGRFLGGGEHGRYVPVDVVLSNTKNESSFDQIKNLVDDWSFRDNNVSKGDKPILISQKEKEIKKSLIFFRMYHGQ